MPKLHIGAVALDGSPRIAVAIRDGEDRAEIDTLMADGVDILELRIDLFSSFDPDYVRNEVKRYSDLPTLATIRLAQEGGAWDRPEEERLALYRAVLSVVQALDIELAAGETLKALIPEAHAAGKTIIGSFHDFHATPSLEQLLTLFSRGLHLRVDLLKVAAFCNSREDLQRLARFTIIHAEDAVITIGMGEYGAPSRILFPALGSRLTYTFLGEPTAPGQLNCAVTIQYLSGIFPEFKRERGMA